MVEALEKTLSCLLGCGYTEHIFTAAILELSETLPDIFEWTFKTFPTLPASLKLLEEATRFAVQKLVNNGFILGRDFSRSCQGKILIKQEAHSVLIACISDAEALLVQKILQVQVPVLVK
ncbi:MAG: hypothetical protein HC908_00195 [Calothrix sp. SM1_7_51]|nr:hypothetical protein [Calothrix sp. SM1_7_51]